MIHRFCGNVFLSEEGVQNQFTLTGELELMLAQVFHQGLHFLHMFMCHAHLRLGLIKDETDQLVKGDRVRVAPGGNELTEFPGAVYSAAV